MLIPLLKEESLRQSEVVAYDPFIVSSRMVIGSSFLYGASYELGDEVFDGSQYYHEVVTNSPNTAPYTSGNTFPEWSTEIGGYTVSGTVKFQNIGTSSRAYGKTDEIVMRIGNGSFAFVQIAFPKTNTPTVESCRLVLTAPIFQMGSDSSVFLAPVVVFEPSLVEASLDGTADVVANGYTFTTGTQQFANMWYASEVEVLGYSNFSGNADIYVNGEGVLKLKPEDTQVSTFGIGFTNVEADINLQHNGESHLKALSTFDTESLVVALVNSAYEPLDFESLTYPETWPPEYVDTTNIISISVPRFGEQVAVDLDKIITTERSVYTLIIFRSSDVVINGGKIKDVARKPILIGGDQSLGIQPYIQPKRNQRTLEQSLYGPYLGYILDTYQTSTGETFPIPWFEASEAKRIAQRMSDINFLALENGLEVKVEYNSASQDFVVTETDFRIIEGIAQNGIQREVQRISPVRIGTKLLYPIGSYDVPWLLVRPDYNPNPIIRLKGALPVVLEASADVRFTVPT